jgi:hypothetical protein
VSRWQLRQLQTRLSTEVFMSLKTPLHLSRALLVTLVGGLSTAACVADTGDQQPENVGEQRDPIAWGSNDNPAKFDVDSSFEYTLDNLPSEGEAEVVPWAGSYWPTYRDSINFRWDGSSGSTPGPNASPAEKFAEAFGRDKLVDNVSKQFGIESRSKTCTQASDCGEGEGVCSKRPGEAEGRCVETWFGICHAWAPAAIDIPEPKKPVTYNGVTFKVNDIKALISLSYTSQVQTQFLSGRCNDKSDELEFDEYGRPIKRECMNTNPGTFHVVATNVLGVQKKSFIEDKTFDYQVWNQPVRGYKVLQNSAVNAQQANELITASGSDYLFNNDAVSFRHMKMKFSYIFEPAQSIGGNLSGVIDNFTAHDTYEYILELDADGKIIGGEWLGASKKNHPDFLWTPTLKGWTEVAKDGGKAGTGIAWHEVMYLVEESVKEDGTTNSGGFDWGDTCDAGNGEFTQPIANNAIVEVGEIPAGKAKVRINLTANNDVDIQLYDKATGHPIVAWPQGDLSGPAVQTTTYEGMTIEYSGYNGVNGDWGSEYIELKGDVTRPLVMKAYGYKAGDAEVTYTYDAASNCVDAGNGEFTQDVVRYDVVNVGRIKQGKNNIRIQLKADNDLDIQLYDGPVALIKWPDGKLSGSSTQTLSYEGMTLEWSGWAGTNGQYGNEYITISGDVPAELSMRVFGYKEGEAEVRYSWGLDDSALSTSLF